MTLDDVIDAFKKLGISINITTNKHKPVARCFFTIWLNPLVGEKDPIIGDGDNYKEAQKNAVKILLQSVR